MLERVTRFFQSDSYFYVLCGVDRTASLESLKSARKMFLLKNHPDKNAEFASNLFMEILLAFRVLMGRESRKAYDKDGKRFRLMMFEHKNDVDKTLQSLERDSDFKYVFMKAIKNTFK